MKKRKTIVIAISILTAFICVMPVMAEEESGILTEVSPVVEMPRKGTVDESEAVPDNMIDDTTVDGEAEDTEQENQQKPMAYSADDLEVLAHAICGEAQSCPDDEQLYVGSVIINRKNHPAYPNSIRGVVFQKGQYACTRDGNYYRQPTEANYRNARRLLEYGSILPGNVVYQSSRRQGRGVYLQTKYHKYCYR